MFKEAYDRIIKNALFTNIFVLANIIVFGVLEINGSTLDSEYMIISGAALAPLIVDYGQYFRLFTAMFLHFGIEHLFNNMLVLFFVGDVLERTVGKVKFVLIYIISGLGASAISCAYNYVRGEIVVSAGASGAIFGVIGALLYVVIVNKGRIEDITSRRLGLLIIFSVYHGYSESGIDNMAHIGGIICGVILGIILYRRKKPSCYFNDDIIQ